MSKAVKSSRSQDITTKTIDQIARLKNYGPRVIFQIGQYIEYKNNLNEKFKKKTALMKIKCEALEGHILGLFLFLIHIHDLGVVSLNI